VTEPNPPRDRDARGRTAYASRSVRWLAAGAWAVVIFGFSAIPGSNVPGRFGSLAHFGEYAIFSALVYGALRLDMNRSRAVVIAVLIASGYAVTDELHQAFVPMRVPDLIDWVVDTLGAAAGATAAAVVDGALMRRRVPSA